MKVWVLVNQYEKEDKVMGVYEDLGLAMFDSHKFKKEDGVKESYLQEHNVVLQRTDEEIMQVIEEDFSNNN